MSIRRSTLARSSLLAITAVAVLAADLAAHDTWLLPSTMRTPVGKSVVILLTSGEAFPADDFAIDPARVTRATVRLRGPSAGLAKPMRSTKSLRFEWTPKAPGVAAFAVELAPKSLTLAPDKIEEYFTEINASRALRSAWESIPNPKQWRESYTKHSSSFVRVGRADSDTSWRIALGMGVELLPLVDPTSLRVGDLLRVKVVRNGKGIGGLQVGLQHEGDSHVSFATSASDGSASFTLKHRGRWLVNCTDLRRTHDAGLEWRSDFVTLTIAVASRTSP